LAQDQPGIHRMTELRQALDDINAIRSQVARGTQFRGYGPISVASSGVLALAVAAAQSRWLQSSEHDLRVFLLVWISTAALAVSLSALETVFRVRRVHSGLALEMMQAAAKSRDDAKISHSALPKLLAITVLTSMDNAALRGVGIAGPTSRRVVQLARLAQKAGMDGVVASPQEVRSIRRACGKGFLIVVPGIRPLVGSGPVSGRKGKTDDQARVATPAEAIRAGADYLVVGRPITGAPDPEAAASAILDEISSALPRI